MGTQDGLSRKVETKRSQLLTEAISRAKENLHEQSRTPEQKALIKKIILLSVGDNETANILE